MTRPWSVDDIPEPSRWTKILTVILLLPFALDSWLSERRGR